MGQTASQPSRTYRSTEEAEMASESAAPATAANATSSAPVSVTTATQGPPDYRAEGKEKLSAIPMEKSKAAAVPASAPTVAIIPSQEPATAAQAHGNTTRAAVQDATADDPTPSAARTSDDTALTGTNATESASAPLASVDTAPAAGLHARGSTEAAVEGGLAAALVAAGHDMSKEDRRNLKREIRNEKNFDKSLHAAGKAEGNAISSAISKSKSSVKRADRATKHVSQYQTKLEKSTDAHARAKQKFLKAESDLKTAESVMNKLTRELEVMKASQIEAIKGRDADQQQVDVLRKAKDEHDMDREKKHAESQIRLSQAKRALAVSGERKGILC